MRSRSLYCCALGLLLSIGAVRAQDGAIVDRDTVAYTEDQQRFFAELFRRNGLDALDLNAVVQRITYLSGGLRVRGYLVEPVEGDSLPAVIDNRGGNQDFDAWTDTTAAFFLAPLAARGYVVAASQYRGNAGGEGREEFGGPTWTTC
ncbi:MAG TPA: hypothetical protein VD838_10135 [Anaeromyxobacteraceae bacterium]|nr:hypothetical protein [Anaeromyxobacteraceae bacterium]